jgi:MFS family permease
MSKLRSFILIWFGQLISGVGSGLTGFTLGVYVYQKTGSATQFTLIFLCGSLPAVIALPLAGTLADRWNLRWTMIIANVGAGLSKLCLVVLLYTIGLKIWHIYLAVIGVSTFGMLLGVPYTVMTSILVPKRHYGRASGMVQTAAAAAQILPPALGGVLISYMEIRNIVLIDVATYLFAILTLLIVRIPARETTATATAAATVDGQAPPVPRRRGALYGWIYIKERPGLLGLLIYFAAVNLVVGSSTVLYTPLVLSFADTAVLGRILSLSGVSFLLGSLLMGVWGGPRKRVYGVFGFGFLFGLCSVLVGLWPSIPLIAIGTFGMFFILPVVNGCSQAIWQSKTPVEVQGRVFAVRRMIGASTLPLAYLLSGPLADKVFEPLMARGEMSRSLGRLIGTGRGRGIALMFIIAGVLTMLAQVGGYLSPRLREVEEELPDATTEEKLPDATTDATTEAALT